MVTTNYYKRIVFFQAVKRAADEKEREQRTFIKDFIILLINTGLRFGEMRKLKWRMIKVYKSKNVKGHDKEFETHAEISVPPDTKTGARSVTGKRGDVFERIKRYSKHTKADDWIFVDNDTGEQIHKKVYYKQWPILMKECGLSDSTKNQSYYSLRHSYITFRIVNDTNVFMLAENVGTSVKMIEDHYAHVKSEAKRYELTKKAVHSEATKFLID